MAMLVAAARAPSAGWGPAARGGGRARGARVGTRPVESTYVGEVVAGNEQALGLPAGNWPTNYYGPGKCWSGEAVQLVGDARLGAEIRVAVPHRIDN